MRKTVSITINGQLFHIEEHAFKKLDEYLDAIHSHFAAYEDKHEIVSDIEARIAEHFHEELSKSRNVIAEADVEKLIAEMGTVKDFKQFEGDESASEEPSTNRDASKRLYRDTENQMIAGVAAGIANYFAIDPTIIRLLFVATILFGGAGVLIYIVLWMVVPEAKTTTEKVEMHGVPLTIKRIEAAIKENIPAAAEKIRKEHLKSGKLKKILMLPFVFIRKIFEAIFCVIIWIFPKIGRVIGFFIAVASSVALFALVFALIMLAVHAWEPYMDIPLRQLAGGLTYYALLVSGFFGLFVPAVMIVLLGVSLMLMKNIFRFPLVISLIGLWVAALVLGAVTAGKEMPALVERIEQYEESHYQETARSISIEDFTSVEAHEGYNVNIRKGTGTSLRVSGSKEMVDGLEANVDEGVLFISRNSENYFCFICLGNSATIDITVTGNVENIEASGGTNMDVDGVNLVGTIIAANGGSSISVHNADIGISTSLQTSGGSHIDIVQQNDIDQLTIEAYAGSRIVYEGNAKTVTGEVHSGTSVDLVGSGATLEMEVTSGSNVDASKFTVTDATIEAMGGAWADVYASGTLSGIARAGSSIYYSGKPTMVNVDEDPSGYLQSNDPTNNFFEENGGGY